MKRDSKKQTEAEEAEEDSIKGTEKITASEKGQEEL